MRKLFIGISVFLVLLIGGLLILPSLVPSDVYKEKIQTQLTKELNRDVQIDGEVKLSVFPSIRAKTDRVVIANPQGFSDSPFVAMDGLEAKVKLLPLLSRRVEISAFKLRNPEISLEKTAKGDANWVLGEPTDTPETTPDEGPFKRDGRYANIDPAIGLFSIENGSIAYRDATKGTVYDLKDVNLSFALPSLSKQVKIDGDVTFNDEPVSLDLTVDSPRSFLNGKATPVSLKLKTNFANIDTKGEFLETQEIAFNLEIDGEVSDMAKLMSYVPNDLPVADIVNEANLSGTYNFDGTTLSATGADISAKGQGLDVAYKGDATLADTPILEGKVDLNISDVARITQLLEMDIAALNLAESVNVSADLNAEGQGFAARNIKADVKGQDLSATFAGVANYGETITASGTFTADAGSVPTLVQALKLDIPQAAALGNADLSGKLNYSSDMINLTNLSASTKGGILEGSYSGDASLGDAISLSGQFETALKSLSEFASVTQTDVPYANAIGQVKAKGTISGAGDNINISNIIATLSDGQLNGEFNGTAGIGKTTLIDGTLDANIPSLRTLAQTTGTVLPASTSTGPIYENFSISGAVKGSPTDITFSNAKIVLDHLKGQGQFDVKLQGTKPFVIGELNLDGLDLRPYMASFAAQNPTGEIQPWSEEELNLAPLRGVDGDFKFTTPNIVTDRLKFGQSDISATLRNGKMTANLPRLNLYGGLGSFTATLDGSGSVPSVALKVDMDDLNSNAFLNAVAGFSRVKGEGATLLDVQGQGRSQAAIMKSLNGKGDFKLLDGEIQGIDLQAFMTGLDQALKSRSLPGGIGQQYVTKFQDITGLFKIENGVAKINQFNLGGFGVTAQGAGQIDLGGQSVDFSLRPRLTTEKAGNLAGFGIPIKLKGGFGSVSAGLDTDLLGEIVAAQAKARLQKELTNQVGGQAGSIIGGILGGGQSKPSTGGNTETQPTSPEDIIGSILGSRKPTEGEDKKAEEEKEPTVEDALLDLFGPKKKKED